MTLVCLDVCSWRVCVVCRESTLCVDVIARRRSAGLGSGMVYNV